MRPPQLLLSQSERAVEERSGSAPATSLPAALIRLGTSNITYVPACGQGCEEAAVRALDMLGERLPRQRLWRPAVWLPQMAAAQPASPSTFSSTHAWHARRQWIAWRASSASVRFPPAAQLRSEFVIRATARDLAFPWGSWVTGN